MSIKNLSANIQKRRDTTLKPPRDLQKKTKAWWLHVVQSYELEEHHVRLLTLACQSWDRCVQARALLKKHGLTYVDQFGQPRPRPEIVIEKDSRIAFARLLREMNLSETLPEIRPPPLKFGRR